MPLKIALLGGAGFVGISLGKALKEQGHEVYVFDFAEVASQNLVYLDSYRKGDVTNAAQLIEAFDLWKPDCVVHLASWGMSGSPMLNMPKCVAINFEGTRSVIEAMQQTEVDCLIYTSTYNVVYGGKEIIQGDESMPYFPLEKHTDAYGPSKALAEQLVLSQNGQYSMRTCAIRPAAIYGPGEARHFPRITKHIDAGIFSFLIGSAQVDWVHIDNLTSAFLKVIEQMSITHDSSRAPCGEAYFISDGQPIDNFEFFRPLLEARGAPFPWLKVPVFVMLCLAFFLENLYRLSAFIGLHIEPFLTRAEVYKVGITHTFSIDKARRDLGYSPRINSVEGSKEMGALYRKNVNNRYFFRFAPLEVYILVFTGMILLATCAYRSDLALSLPEFVDKHILDPVHELGLFLFRSQTNLQWLLIAACAIHLIEAIYAARKAALMGCETWPAWFLQTILLGYGSVYLLSERESWMLKISKKSKTG